MRGRDIYVISWLVILFFVSWFVSLGRLVGYRFWDPKHSLEQLRSHPVDGAFYNSTAVPNISPTCYSPRRYIYFFPHIICAILWWNLYFFQLIPYIRKTFPWMHRYLGRFLMVVVVVEIATGCGMASTSDAAFIKIISVVYAIVVSYCVYMAWRYAAVYKDIPRHKFWAIRLVGYLQAFTLQRFWLMAFIITYKYGWTGLFPALTEEATDEQIKAISSDMLIGAFLLGILHATFTTEWYLSLEMGMTDIPRRETSNATQHGCETAICAQDPNPEMRQTLGAATSYSSFDTTSRDSSQKDLIVVHGEAQPLL